MFDLRRAGEKQCWSWQVKVFLWVSALMCLTSLDMQAPRVDPSCRTMSLVT